MNPIKPLLITVWFSLCCALSVFGAFQYGVSSATLRSLPALQENPAFQVPRFWVRPSQNPELSSQLSHDDVYILSKEDLLQFKTFVGKLKGSTYRTITLDCRLIQSAPMMIDLLKNAQHLNSVQINLLGVWAHNCHLTPFLEMLEKASSVKSLRVDLVGMGQLSYLMIADDYKLLSKLPTKKFWIGNVSMITHGMLGFDGYFHAMSELFRTAPYEEFTIDQIGKKSEGKIEIYSHKITPREINYNCNSQKFEKPFTRTSIEAHLSIGCDTFVPFPVDKTDVFISELNTAISTSPQRERYLELGYAQKITLSPKSAQILAEMDVDTIAGLSHVSDPEIIRILLKTGKPKLYEPVSLPFYSDEM